MLCFVGNTLNNFQRKLAQANSSGMCYGKSQKQCYETSMWFQIIGST